MICKIVPILVHVWMEILVAPNPMEVLDATTRIHQAVRKYLNEWLLVQVEKSETIRFSSRHIQRLLARQVFVSQRVLEPPQDQEVDEERRCRQPRNERHDGEATAKTRAQHPRGQEANRGSHVAILIPTLSFSARSELRSRVPFLFCAPTSSPPLKYQ